jgi:transposase-like protein
MAERRTWRRFTVEFKAEVVKRLLADGKGLSEVATELGLSPGQLSAWRNEHLEHSFPRTRRHHPSVQS